MWWEIIQSIVSHFKADDALSFVSKENIKAGIPEGEEAPEECPAIRVCRGGESNLDLLSRGKGDVTILIFCWEESDSQEPEDAYRLLSAMERKVIDSLMAWLEIAPKELKAKLSFDIPAIASDGDTFRPTVGSRITLVIKYYK